MNPRYSIVVVHGINGESGTTQAGFSTQLADLVLPEKALQDKFWHEAVWEGVCDDLDNEVKNIVVELVKSYDFEQYFKARMAKKKGVSKVLPVIGNVALLFGKWVLSDFVCTVLDHALDLPLYLGDAYGAQMLTIVEDKIQSASEQTNGVVVVGHSLGSVIAYDAVTKLLMKAKPPAIKGLVTMGSPLEWVTGLRMTRKGSDVPHLMSESLQWINFYNKEDPVPMKKALSQETFPKVKNLEIIVKTKKPLAAHSAYWSDSNVAEHIKRLVFADTD